VLRKQKRTTLSWKVPDAETRVFERTRRPRREEPSAYKLRPALPLRDRRLNVRATPIR